MHLTRDAPLIVLCALVLAAAVLSSAVASLTMANRELRRSADLWESAAGALVPAAQALSGLRLHHPVAHPDGSFTVVCDEPIDGVVEMRVTAAGERQLTRNEILEPCDPAAEARPGS